MQNYETDAGNILEARILEDKGDSKVYEFLLHVRKQFGEDIVILNKLPLTSPDYFIQKYIAEN